MITAHQMRAAQVTPCMHSNSLLFASLYYIAAEEYCVFIRNVSCDWQECLPDKIHTVQDCGSQRETHTMDSTSELVNEWVKKERERERRCLDTGGGDDRSSIWWWVCRSSCRTGRRQRSWRRSGFELSVVTPCMGRYWSACVHLYIQHRRRDWRRSRDSWEPGNALTHLQYGIILSLHLFPISQSLYIPTPQRRC